MAARHDRVVVDIGAGSGSAVLRRAAREPATLFVAVDAHAAAMSDASRRAARPTRRGGLSNVIFLAAAAETLPDGLSGLADEVTVVLPWGSLLAATLEPACAVFASLVACLKPGGEMMLLLSAEERDHVAAELDLDAEQAHSLALNYVSSGFDIAELRPATRNDIQRLSSAWGKRLGIPERRQAWLFRLRLR